MTRAKRAMYLIAKPPGKSTSRNFPKLLAETLGGENVAVRVGQQEFAGTFVAGDVDWHTRLAAAAPVPKVGLEIGRLDPAAFPKSPRLPSRQPSAEKTGAVNAGQVFSLEGQGGADFGTAVHALFAEVEWACPPAVEKMAAAWRMRGATRAAVEEVLACLRTPDLAAIWERPAGGGQAEVWRERTFEVVLDGTWVTGIFDRVVTERDAGGRVMRVTVFDFKTDRLGDETGIAAVAGRYAEQLNLYRRAAAVLAGVAVTAVAGELVLTRVRRRVTVPGR